MSLPSKFLVDEREVDMSAIRAQGAGGQNVNKVSSAIHLRFDITASSLPDEIKVRLLDLNDSRLTLDGVLVLKAQQHRTQEMNRADALMRLQEVVARCVPPAQTAPRHQAHLRLQTATAARQKPAQRDQVTARQGQRLKKTLKAFRYGLSKKFGLLCCQSLFCLPLKL